ncbi:sensor histidine kinase [Streptomyces sp. NPDC099050]|uniref:sensor histidine kinase n=1 Tax=Streptomyces sp. NPDC099050 TaxID=3366100 RepID=UPI00381F75F1
MDSSSAPVFAEALYEGLVRATRSPGASPTARLLPRPRTPTTLSRRPVAAPAIPTSGLLGTDAEAILQRFTHALPSLRLPERPDASGLHDSCVAYARHVLRRAEAACSPSPENTGDAGDPEDTGDTEAIGDAALPAPGPAEPVAGGSVPRHLAAAGTLLLECALLQATQSGTADDGAAMARGVAVVRMLGEAMRTAEFGPGQGDPGWSESRRLFRWLHDELGNALAVALHRIELGEDDPDRAAPHLAVAKRVLGETAQGNRNLLGALRRSSSAPPVRDALQQWLSDTGSRAQVTIRVTGDETLASERCRRELFLVLREALRNCLAHAGAERIEVSVRTTRRWLYARVRDDGAGFTVEDAFAETGAGHGLRAMRGRVEDLGGRLRVGSAPGEGTRVEIHLPLSIRP